MAKAIKKVFTPDRYELTIGENDYVIEPRPMTDVIEFYDAVETVIGSFDAALDTPWFVEVEGERVAGPFESEEKASEVIDEHEGGQVVAGEVSFKGLIEKLLAAPYEPLSIVIPGLSEEDLQTITFPELTFVIDLVIEVNGLKLFKSFVKKTVMPVLPKILDTMISSTVEALNTSTGILMETNGDQI